MSSLQVAGDEETSVYVWSSMKEEFELIQTLDVKLGTDVAFTVADDKHIYLGVSSETSYLKLYVWSSRKQQFMLSQVCWMHLCAVMSESAGNGGLLGIILVDVLPAVWRCLSRHCAHGSVQHGMNDGVHDPAEPLYRASADLLS